MRDIYKTAMETDGVASVEIKEFQRWGKKPDHGKAIRAEDSVPVEIQKALGELAENGMVTCVGLWRIADRLGVERKTLSAACETLGIKIRGCQLGAF